jgi:hypothetical protein
MDLYVVINPYGTAGGGLFRDEFEEHCIRDVKDCLRNTHGGLDDIKLEKEIGGLSVLTGIQQHNRSSVLRGKEGKEHAKDMVGDTVREILEEKVSKYNPFAEARRSSTVFWTSPRATPSRVSLSLTWRDSSRGRRMSTTPSIVNFLILFYANWFS